MMNDTFILPNMNYSIAQTIDCSQIGLQLCNQLEANMDFALIIMGIGLLLQMSRKFISWLGENYIGFRFLSDYLETSLFPELLILVSFIFLVYMRMIA